MHAKIHLSGATVKHLEHLLRIAFQGGDVASIKRISALLLLGDERPVEMVAQRRFSRMVAWHDRGVIDVPLSDVTIGARTLDPNDALIRTARGLGIHLGEQRAKKRA